MDLCNIDVATKSNEVMESDIIEQGDNFKTPSRSEANKRPIRTIEVTKRTVRRRLFTDDESCAEDNNYKAETNTRAAVEFGVLEQEEDSNGNADEYNQREEEIIKLKTRPTVNRFVYGNEIIDLRSPLPGYEGASVMLTNVYNTFVHIVKLKNTLCSMKDRKLTIQLRAVEHHLRKLEENSYVNGHVQLPQIVESLFSMWDYRSNSVYVNQLKPISCMLNKEHILKNVSFRSMEATSKNDSNYIEFMFNNPFRFIFIGCATRVGVHNKNAVSPFPFFGEYINTAIGNMYDVMYNMVTKEIKKAKEKLLQREQAELAKTGEGDQRGALTENNLRSMETYSNNRQVRGGTLDTDRLHSYLRSINLPLVKMENVDILITSGNSGKKSTDTAAKMRWLTVEKGNDSNDVGQLKMVEADVTQDAVYMSSYIRCRVLILDQPTFSMQIYNRHAIKLITMDDRLVKFADDQ